MMQGVDLHEEWNAKTRTVEVSAILTTGLEIFHYWSAPIFPLTYSSSSV